MDYVPRKVRRPKVFTEAQLKEKKKAYFAAYYWANPEKFRELVKVNYQRRVAQAKAV